MSIVFEICKESANPVQTITYFATKGANLNETDGDDNTVLHLFVVRDNKDAVKALLEAGVRVDLHDQDGCTPLHLACGAGSREIVRLLLGRDADLFVKNKQVSVFNSLTKLWIVHSLTVGAVGQDAR